MINYRKYLIAKFQTNELAISKLRLLFIYPKGVAIIAASRMFFAKLLLSCYSFNILTPWSNSKFVRTCGCQIITQICFFYLLRIAMPFKKKILKGNAQSVQGKTIRFWEKMTLQCQKMLWIILRLLPGYQYLPIT